MAAHARDSFNPRAPTQPQFDRLTELLERWTGIRLTHTKRNLVISRLGPRIEALGLLDFGSYLDLLQSDEGSAERRDAINRLTTNKTSFFRDPEHFERLKAHLRGYGSTDEIQIWSAGCSSGEEPYSIAMTVRHVLDAPRVRILATDLCDQVLEQAKAAVYSKEATRAVPHDLALGSLEPAGEDTVRVTKAVRAQVSFARLNLMGHWPMRGPFAAIFCRNVMIYFDEATRRRLVERYIGLLEVGGLLFVGSAESLPPDIARLGGEMPSVYRRVR